MLQCPRCGRQFSNDVLVCPSDLTPLQADTTLSDVPTDPLLGRVFEGKYRLDEPLGGGNMGTVYRATHLLIDRQVAVKVLSQRFVGDQTAQQRFRREARAAGRMQHPNAVTVTDFGATDDGYLYIVMELLEGRTLRDLLAREAPLDPARAVSLMLQVCGAVGAAHEAGLIHRDLKPANIFIEQRANLPAAVKVLDFGIAKFVVEEHDDDYNTLTQVGAIIGTPRYMSPEQSSGVAALTPASDVYSLGIILYEMLTGVAPFSGDTPLAIALKQVSAAPPPMQEAGVSVPAELERTVLHAMAKDPANRPHDAGELRRELHHVAERLGLEHAESLRAPTLDDLRSAGTESPSGQLVIDLATLRQVQAAGNRLPAPNEPNSTPVADAPSNSNRPEFARMNVPLVRTPSQRSLLVIAAMILLIVLLGSAVIAARWWRGVEPSIGVATKSETTPTPTVSPSPSPSPSPPDKPNPPPRRRPSEKPSTAKKVWNRIKGIFK